MDDEVMFPNKPRRLRRVKTDTIQYFEESRRLVNKTVKDKTPRMEEESNPRWRQHKTCDVDKPKLDRRRTGREWSSRKHSQYLKVMKEMGSVREELSKLKQDMASILDEKDNSMSSNSAATDETCKSKRGLVQGNETKLAIIVSPAVQMFDNERYNEMDKEWERYKKPVLESITGDLEALRNELASVKDENSQFTASMEIVRDELLHVRKEAQMYKKKEERANAMIHDLTSSLAKANAKMEAKSTAAEKAKTTSQNLTRRLEEINSKSQAAEEERSSIRDENAFTKEEIHKVENDIKMAEEMLRAAMQQLKTIKASEAMAIENLKGVMDNATRSGDLGDGSVSMSKFEYDYMKGNAGGGVLELAEKKVGAMQAWVEALKASEKEMVIKGELLRREHRERRSVEKKG